MLFFRWGRERFLFSSLLICFLSCTRDIHHLHTCVILLVFFILFVCLYVFSMPEHTHNISLWAIFLTPTLSACLSCGKQFAPSQNIPLSLSLSPFAHHRDLVIYFHSLFRFLSLSLSFSLSLFFAELIGCELWSLFCEGENERGFLLCYVNWAAHQYSLSYFFSLWHFAWIAPS